MKTAVSELERRGKLAKELIESILPTAGDKLEEAKSVKDAGRFWIYENKIDSSVKGTERMLAVGGGVKAKIIKDKSGHSVIESFQFDKDRFSEVSAKAWIEKNKKSIEQSLEKVQEAQPVGSFADTSIRLQNALNQSSIFPSDNYGCCLAYVMHIFPGYCVACYNDEYYRVDYEEDDGFMRLSDPKKVNMEFVLAESAKAEERNRRFMKNNVDLPVNFGIKEASIDEEKREVIVVLIEAGKNMSKRRYYPESTIKEAAPLFAGLKMYLDHPTEREEREKPERSLSAWISTIVESWYEDGKAMGRVKIHSDEFWDKLKSDSVFRENVGVSINASGKSYQREIDGIDMQVVEMIALPKSVDWVTEPGARGRVLAILESNKKMEEDKTMLKTVKLEEVKSERPDIWEAAIKEGRELEKKDKEAADAKALKEANEKAENDKKENELKESRAKKIREMLGASKLHKKSIERICEELMKESFADDAAVEKRVKEAISAELAYLKEATGGRSIGVETGSEQAIETVTESQTRLENRLGLGKKDEEKK